MLKKILYTILRLASLFVSASALPLGMAYFLRHGGDISGITMTVALYTVLMVWSMVFIVVSQTQYPTSFAGAITTTVPALALIWFQIATNPDWLLSLYTWLLASLTSLLVVGIALTVAATTRQSTNKQMPWWGYALMCGALVFTGYFIYVFAQPFLAHHTVAASIIVLLAEVLLISTPAIKALLTKKHSFSNYESASGTWEMIVIATTLLSLLATLLVKPILFA